MLDIKHENLLSLHDQIEKAEAEQQKIEDLLEKKSVELKKNRASKQMLKILCSILLLIIIAILVFRKKDDSIEIIENKEFSVFESDINDLKNQMNELKVDQSEFKNLKNLYLSRSLIQKDTVYSVQIQSFTDEKVALISDKYVNSLIYADAPYYKLSLGIFETLSEAQEFRKTLLRSGVIDKNIFVISYKEGKRLRIENPI